MDTFWNHTIGQNFTSEMQPIKLTDSPRGGVGGGSPWNFWWGCVTLFQTKRYNFLVYLLQPWPPKVIVITFRPGFDIPISQTKIHALFNTKAAKTPCPLTPCILIAYVGENPAQVDS